MATDLERGRSAFAVREWRVACTAFAAAASSGSLDRDDCERRAVAGYLAGLDAECDAGWESAHRAALAVGDPAGAAEPAMRTTEIGARTGDDDVRAFGTLGHGQAFSSPATCPAGIARLDEVMLAVSSGDVGPIASGIADCAVIIECRCLHDLARAERDRAAAELAAKAAMERQFVADVGRFAGAVEQPMVVVTGLSR